MKKIVTGKKISVFFSVIILVGMLGGTYVEKIDQETKKFIRENIENIPDPLSEKQVDAVHSVGVAFGSYYDKQEYIPYLAELGVQDTYINIFWDRFEPNPGNYDFGEIDSFISQLKPDTFAFLRISARQSSWGTKDPEKTVPKDLSIGGAFYNYVYNVVKRTNGRIKYFENEWEADCVKKHWNGTAEEYAQMTLTFYRAVKDADPDAKVILGVADGILSDCSAFTTEVLDYLAGYNPDSFDVFDMHLYHISIDNEIGIYDIPYRVQYFRNLLDSYPEFKGKPIIVTECGGPSPTEFAYVDKDKFVDLVRELADDPCIFAGDLKSTPLHPEGYPDPFRMFAYGLENEPELDAKRDRIQGKQMTQRTVLAFSAGVTKIFWWNFKNKARVDIDCYYRHPIFGKMSLMTENRTNGTFTPNPTFKYYQMMAKYLNHCKCVARVDTGDPEIYLFEVTHSDNSTMYVLWEKRDQFYGENQPLTEYTFSVPFSSVKITDVYGNEKTEIVDNGVLSLYINDTPIFIEDFFSVNIKKPRSNCLYLFDRIAIPSIITLIIGKLTIEVETYDSENIEKVEFYVDDILENTDYESPFEWLWDGINLGKHTLTVIAYDKKGNTAVDEITVLTFNL